MLPHLTVSYTLLWYKLMLCEHKGRRSLQYKWMTPSRITVLYNINHADPINASSKFRIKSNLSSWWKLPCLYDIQLIVTAPYFDSSGIYCLSLVTLNNLSCQLTICSVLAIDYLKKFRCVNDTGSGWQILNLNTKTVFGKGHGEYRTINMRNYSKKNKVGDNQ